MTSKVLYGIVFILFASATGQASEIRRVVTGLSADNKAIVLFDSRDTLAVGKSGNGSLNLWTTDASPPSFSFKDDAAKKPLGLSPPDNGTAFRVVEFPPTTPVDEAKMDPQLMMRLVGDHAPARGLPVRHPFMHRTRTVDYAIIMSGEIDMKLDDSVVHLKAGDVVVQQATNHAWINHSGQPVRVMFVLMDSKQP